MTELVPQATLFDYSSAITGLSNDIASSQSDLAGVNSKIALLQSAVGYDSVTSPALAGLINQQSQLTTTIDDLQATLTEITAITNLDSNTQGQLYYFYTVIGGSYVDFMVRMPFNYETALVDPAIVALLSDTTNSADAKTAVAGLVFGNYPIFSAHIRSLISLYRYLR